VEEARNRTARRRANRDLCQQDCGFSSARVFGPHPSDQARGTRAESCNIL